MFATSPTTAATPRTATVLRRACFGSNRLGYRVVTVWLRFMVRTGFSSNSVDLTVADSSTTFCFPAFKTPGFT